LSLISNIFINNSRYAEILGNLSKKHFEKITETFLSSIEKASNKVETIVLIESMKYIKLDVNII
jgi:hypothetical protein